MTIEFGLSLPAGPPRARIPEYIADIDRALTDLRGQFTSLWMTDHFFWDDLPTHEAWTVLAYAAARWPTLRLGPVVLGQSYRNPALLAKMAATLQWLSGGRLILGIGAGWKQDEYHAYGYPYPDPATRVGQLGDALEIIKRMWTQPGRVSYHGRYYQITEAYCEPKPVPVPPILVGGGGRTTMRLAAQYADLWNIPDAGFAEYRARLDILEQHCETLGRDPATLRRSWFGRLAVAGTEAEALAFSEGRWTSDNAFCGTPTQVVEQMAPFIAAGVDFFIVEVLGLDRPDTAPRIVDELLPRVQRLARG